MKVETVLGLSLGFNLILALSCVQLRGTAVRATDLAGRQSLVLSNAVVIAERFEKLLEGSLAQTREALDQRDKLKAQLEGQGK